MNGGADQGDRQSFAHGPVPGRDDELARIGAWLAEGAQSGPAGQPEAVTTSTTLVIEGEPGIGKTTLWNEAVRLAQGVGWRVLACRPAPLDAGLPYAGLSDLLRPVPDDAFAGLPGPQRRPLAVALLREEAGEGDLDPRAVGTGLTSLLAVVAERQRLLIAGAAREACAG